MKVISFLQLKQNSPSVFVLCFVFTILWFIWDDVFSVPALLHSSVTSTRQLPSSVTWINETVSLNKKFTLYEKVQDAICSHQVLFKYLDNAGNNMFHWRILRISQLDHILVMNWAQKVDFPIFYEKNCDIDQKRVLQCEI